MNNTGDYIQLTIKAPSQWEDILSGLLFAYGALGVEIDDPSIIAAHLAAGDWDASVFDGQTPDTGQVVLRALFAEKAPALLYEEIHALCPQATGLFQISAAPLPRQDWQQIWRETFPTLLLGERLAVMPYWRQETPPQKAIPLYIAPGTAFGTGDHATTALVAELLQQYLQPGQRVLDLGCGSGILAISALKLGADMALAVDVDGECAQSVAEHRALNGISRKQLPFLQGDILSEAEPQTACRAFAAHIALSNIVAGVIIPLAAHMSAYLQPGGLWVSSGILLEKENAVQAALAENGWQIVERRERGEWVALAAKKPFFFEKKNQKTFSINKLEKNNPKIFKIYSLGCKVNQEEGEQLAALFTEHGWQEAVKEHEAGLYIINTCTVTQVADKKSRALIRRLRRQHPAALLAVTGCYAQTSAKQIAELDAVDIIAGLRERANLPFLVERRLQEGAVQTAVADIGNSKDFVTIGPAKRQKRSRAYLKIEDGCGEFCHYCVIPYARGPVRSLPLAQALAEARALLAAGHRELVLSGIHIGAYGEDLPPGEDLPALIEGILGLADTLENFRLRLGSLEPQQFSEKLLGLIAREQRLCPHLHIPLQAGCNDTLRQMNRRYTTAVYAALVKELRSLRPGLAITTDVLVGFPGESAENFATSLKFCRDIGFAKTHVFPYSRRNGTVAATLPGQIAQQEKNRRAALMNEGAQASAKAYARSFIGGKLQYLFEQELAEQPDAYRFAGHSENYLPLLLAAAPPSSQLLAVRCLDYRSGFLLCEMI